MKNTAQLMMFSILFLSFMSLTGCTDTPSGPAAEDPRPIPSIYMSGTLELPEGCTVEYSNLKVLSFADSDEISTDGRYRLQVPITSSQQQLIFVTKEEEEPVFISIIDPVSESVFGSDSTTAAALLLMNPYLLDVESGYRDEFLATAVSHSEFSSLLSMLQSAYATNAQTALSYSSNPLVYQLASQISKETFETLGGRWTSGTDEWGDAPEIIDAPGPDIAFVNARSIFYTAAVYEWEELMTMQDLVTVDCWHGLYEMTWGWPATYTPVLTNTQYEMGDGYFMIEFYRKGNESYSNPSGWWSAPQGQALALNTAKTVLIFIEHYTGYLGGYNADQAQALINNLEIPAYLAEDLENAIEEENTLAFAESFSELVELVSAVVAQWFWDGTENSETLTYLENLSRLMKNTCQGFAASSFGTSEGTFFWDFIHAPDSIVYYVAQEGDSLWFFEPEENLPPTAIFTFTPDYGIPDTEFTFDASESYDGEDPPEDLQFRWDWENDGIWDTSWSNLSTVVHSYDETGTYAVLLEVMDLGGLTDSTTDEVVVQEYMITITEPNASSVWKHFETDVLIEWSYPAVPSSDSVISIILYEGDFNYIATLVSVIPNSGSWSFSRPVPMSWTPGTEYRIYIDAVGEDYGVSEYFTIEAETGQEVITVTEPAGTTDWTHFESDCRIEWSYPTTLSGDSVRLELWVGGMKLTDLSGYILNSGEYTLPFLIPMIWEPGDDYQVKIIDNYSNWGYSDYFKITPSQGADVINVVSPQQGDEWIQSEMIPAIRWEYPATASGAYVQIRLLSDTIDVILAEWIDNELSYNHPTPIPSEWGTGGNYRIRILDDLGNYGESEAFIIKPSQCLLVASANPMRDSIVDFVSSLGYSISVSEDYPTQAELSVYDLLIAMKPDTTFNASYFDSYVAGGGSIFFNGLYLKLLGSPQWAGGSGFVTLAPQAYAHQAYYDNPLGAQSVMKDDTLFYASNPESGPVVMTEPGQLLEIDAYLEFNAAKYTVCCHIEYGSGKVVWTASWFCPWDNGISGYTTDDYKNYLEAVYDWLLLN